MNAIIHDTNLPAEERARRSRLRQLLRQGVFLRGSLFAMKRRCGKPSCHCAHGEPHRSPILDTHPARWYTASMDLLEALNPVQREAVTHRGGPLLVFAGAGSGKTRVLTHRVAYLIRECGVHPANILAVTFTNKAANEMKERIARLVGPLQHDIWVGTFHALSARMLRIHGHHIGLDRDFVIYDDQDQESVVKECCRALAVDEKRYTPRALLSAISRAKERLIGPDEYAEAARGAFERVVAEVYPAYVQRLRVNHALDFDDLIAFAVQLLRESPEVREIIQGRFQHVLVDEFQDINHSQYEWTRLVAAKHQNITVVGDDDQCVVANTPISTPAGAVPVEAIAAGTRVVAGCGWGDVAEGEVDATSTTRYSGKIVRIRTDSGRELRCTPNHFLFARWVPQPDHHYVYLMWRRDKGYRIGVTGGVRSRRAEAERVSGFKVRTNQEVADKLWILKAAASSAEAHFYEQLYAFEYGIPTTVFHVRGRRMALTQEMIDDLYMRIDTGDRAARLLADLHLFEEYPHHVPEAVQRAGSDRKVVNVTAFGDPRSYLRRPWHDHRIQLITSDEGMRSRVEAISRTRPGKLKTWRVETSRMDYDEAQRLAERLASVDGLRTARRARLTADKPFSYMPASHLHPGMLVPVVDGSAVRQEKVVSVDFEEYEGPVYDLSVANLRNYCAGGILVHNSIYSWRGADVRLLLAFERDFPNTRVVKLEQNYRSTAKILDVAHHVVSRNRERAEKRLWTEREPGRSVRVHRALNEYEEAAYAVSRVAEACIANRRRYSDFAILYRMNSQSRPFEDALRQSAIPYRVVGGLRFYDRKEVKDLVAYLRLVANPADSVSLRRVVNVPLRGIGPTTLARLQQHADVEAVSLLGAMRAADQIQGIGPSIRKKIAEFVALMDDLRALSARVTVAELLKAIVDRTRFQESLESQTATETDSRKQNVEELLKVALDFPHQTGENTLGDFLEQMALVSDVDNLREGEEGVVLMTLHAAKGLEFP
ncbi:MAG: UvrD-helicase domain-containing protein, partial [Armatimonadetes bacterium]|nr:UvrD-helicase domain-containing protein [Armatimonadota bacterium]